MAVLIGIIGGLSEKQIVNTFITGAADMMSVVLVIALARVSPSSWLTPASTSSSSTLPPMPWLACPA
ncbi:MAG: hypothetical protein ACLU37_05545 [Collinsella sp.]